MNSSTLSLGSAASSASFLTPEESTMYSQLVSPIFSSDLDTLQILLQQFRARDEAALRRVINEADSDGFRLIHRATSSGSVEICRELLLAGADPNALNAAGDSALHWACFSGNYDVTELLLKYGADPLQKSSTDGKTPLDAAVEERHGHILQLFFTAPWKFNFISAMLPKTDSVLYRGALKIKLSILSGGNTSGISPRTAPPSVLHLPVKTCRVLLSLLCRTVFFLHDDLFDAIRFDQLLAVRHKPKTRDKFVLYCHVDREYAAQFFATGEEANHFLGAAEEDSRRLLLGMSKRFSFKRTSANSNSQASFKLDLARQGQARSESAVLVLHCQVVSSAEQDKWIEHFKMAGLLARTLAAVRIQSLARGFLARLLLRKQREQQSKGKTVVKERTLSATLSGRFVALDAAHTPPPPLITPSPPQPTTSAADSNSTQLVESHMSFLPVRLASLKLGGSGGLGASKRLSKRTSSPIASFRSASTSSSTLGMPVEDAYDNFEDISGYLKKRSETGVSHHLRLWKLRFAILSHTSGQLQYYDHIKDARRRKIKRIDFSTMLSISKLPAPAFAFQVRLVGGKTFRFEAMDEEDCKRWIKSLRSVLPRENVAALEIQRVFRGHLARRQAAQLRDLLYKKKQQFLQAEVDRIDEARKRSFAEHVKRQEREAEDQQKLDRLEAEAFTKRQAEKRKQLAKSIALPPNWRAFVDANTGKLYYYNKKTKQTRWKPPPMMMSQEAAAEEETADEWKEYRDEATGRLYYVHTKTNESTWKRPATKSTKRDAAAAGVAVEPSALVAASAAATKTSAAAWRRHLDVNSNRYFYMNERTGERSWTKPAAPVEKAWIALVDPASQREYFSNSVTGESVWVLPAGHSLFTQEEMEDAMIKHLEYLLGGGKGERIQLDLEQAVLDSNGLLLCKALERINPDALDNRCFDSHETNFNLVFYAMQRLGVCNRALNCSKQCKISDLVWRILKLDLLLPVSILSFPGLLEYKLPGETVQDFHSNVLPEAKLMRWLGITNWKDAKPALARVLGIEGSDVDVFDHCAKLGVPIYCSEEQAARSRGEEDERYIMACCAVVFRAFPPNREFPEVTEAQLDLMHEQEREEYMLHNWFQLDDTQSLYAHLRTGTFLIDYILALLAKDKQQQQQLDKQVVVHRNSNQRADWLENAEIVLELARQLPITALQGSGSSNSIGPNDLVDGNPRQLLPFLQCLVSASFKQDEQVVLEWANTTVKRFAAQQQQVDRKIVVPPANTSNNTARATSVRFIERPLVQQEKEGGEDGEEAASSIKTPPKLKSALVRRSQTPLPCKEITSFRDKSLCTACFLLCLLHATVISSTAGVSINWKHMIDPASVDLKTEQGREACEKNAKYLISLAAKSLPDSVMAARGMIITWEDVVQVKQEPIFAFVCLLMGVAK